MLHKYDWLRDTKFAALGNSFYLLLFDLPLPGVAYALGWKFPALAVTWIFVTGTLWW
jgi:hypothetical protein